jgi:hypothetical protein
MAEVSDTSEQVTKPSIVADDKSATYFSALQVQNIRCFGNEIQRLSLSDSSGVPQMFTILLGDNSTGKTTVLQSLAGAEQIGSLIFVEREGKKEREKSTRLWIYEFFFEDRFAPIQRNSGRGHIRVSFLRSAEGLAANDLGSASITLDGRVLGLGTPIGAPEAPMCFGYGAGRGLGSGSASTSEIDDPAASLFVDGIKLRDAEDWLSKLDYSASKPSSIQTKQVERLNRVRRILIEILPEVADIRFTQPSDSSPNPRVEFKTPYGWVPFKALGHGYRSMISWMVDFASRMVDRYPNSPNPLAEPAVVLVDEIDLHLHPKWQRQIIPHLRGLFPKTQFIVTAHSPLIVQSALDPNVRANVAVLRREGDHVIIDNDVESIRAWTIDQILTSPIFGLPTARPASLDEKLRRRKEILSKPALDDKDRGELRTLEAEIGTLPSGENADDAQRLLKITEETQELLKKYKGTGS